MKRIFDEKRLFAKMNKRKMDALVIFKPENFFYFTNYKAHVGGEIMIAPRHAAAIAVIPADRLESSTMIINSWEEVPARSKTWIRDVRIFPVWMEIYKLDDFLKGKISRVEKPVQYSIADNIKMLGEILREEKLDKANIGIELDFISQQVFAILKEELPGARFIDSSAFIHDVQAVKSTEEIEIIKKATQMAQLGLRAVAEAKIEGATVDDVKLIYQRVVMKEASENPNLGYQGHKVTMSIGGDFAPKTGSSAYRAVLGDIVFIDPGVMLKNYRSDIGRSLVVGKPKDYQKKIISALRAGIEAMCEAMKPGAVLSDIFEIGQEAVREAGIDSYTRGHLGHAIGLGKGERPPFVAKTDETVLEKGMVFSIETPLYVHDAGGFQIEDSLVVVEEGIELFTDLPRDLIEVR